MASKSSFIVGLDLGSTKTCVLVCELLQNGKLRVAGFSAAESKGWRRGVIVNLDSALLSIKKAVEAAEDAAGTPIDNAFIGVGGPHIKGVNSRGGITLSRPAQTSREVTGEDVRRVFQAAQAVSLPADRQVVYAERQEYVLDSQDGIRNPVGMTGSRLEVNVHLVTASVTAHENVVAAVNRAGIVVNETVYEALAAAESCLAPDERELGVALLDIGGSNSHLIIYHQGSVRYSGVVPVGGDHFTNDIAVGLRTPIPEAEKMKVSWGQHDLSQDEDAMLEVASVGERPARTVSYSVLGDIIEPRAQELLELVSLEIERSGFSTLLGGGLVLTGGGGKLGGLAAMAEQALGLPARLGQPYGLESMGDALPDAAYATLVGLVLHGLRLRSVINSRPAGLSGKLWGIFRGN
ncbi:MAG: cell division protein FtsA [Terriglobia bacterium]